MASRIYTQTNKQELLDLAEEMTRMALVATRAAEELGDGCRKVQAVGAASICATGSYRS